MTDIERVSPVRRFGPRTAAFAFALVAVGCSPAGQSQNSTNLWAPGVDSRKDSVDPLIIGHRLMAAQEYELALEAFTRATLNHGLTSEILSSLGSANLGLGRLGQAEELLRQAAKKAPDWAEPHNNLGIVLLERGKTAEAVQILKRAYALNNGESDAIRDNLRLALEKFENTPHSGGQSTENNTYKLVQQGGGSYAIRKSPNL
ncbi:tetratricopeptide repeat protein [Pseudophaeobacter sp. EL27]|uniref:tetratricopeptide repeat protein n=1 Tax=Pseudophaeobacter sp. EL27 TaxID=2107580 RepID=UPI000EFB949D|nr:tetratricopeptide repeat protein [Pseudophaeobacter sp. EL27]